MGWDESTRPVALSVTVEDWMAERVGHVRREVAVPAVLIGRCGQSRQCRPGRRQIGRDVAGTARLRLALPEKSRK